MNDEELKYREWQTPLQELILEFDRTKLPEKVQKVETLVLERLMQLRQGNDGEIETQAINDALVLLRIIKRDKLGFPDWECAMAVGGILQHTPRANHERSRSGI